MLIVRRCGTPDDNDVDKTVLNYRHYTIIKIISPVYNFQILRCLTRKQLNHFFFRIVKIIKCFAGFLINALTCCATLSGNYYEKNISIKSYLILLFISIGIMSQNENVPNPLNIRSSNQLTAENIFLDRETFMISLSLLSGRSEQLNTSLCFHDRRLHYFDLVAFVHRKVES